MIRLHFAFTFNELQFSCNDAGWPDVGNSKHLVLSHVVYNSASSKRHSLNTTLISRLTTSNSSSWTMGVPSLVSWPLPAQFYHTSSKTRRLVVCTLLPFLLGRLD